MTAGQANGGEEADGGGERAATVAARCHGGVCQNSDGQGEGETPRLSSAMVSNDSSFVPPEE